MTDITTLAVIGAHSREGLDWLAARFPGSTRRARAIALSLPYAELDAVLWGERLRQEARDAGVRLSIGVSEHVAGPIEDTLAEAADAFRRAFRIGGDITLPYSNLVRAAAS